MACPIEIIAPDHPLDARLTADNAKTRRKKKEKKHARSLVLSEFICTNHDMQEEI
jgi:hypothetical protein